MGNMPKATVDLYFGECNGTAGFKINQLEIEPNTLAQGTHTFEFEYNYGESIEFMMFGKGQSYRDTVIEQGQIMQDKHVSVTQLRLQYITLEHWHFCNFIFDPYFGFDREKRYIHLPDRKDFPVWYLGVAN